MSEVNMIIRIVTDDLDKNILIVSAHYDTIFLIV